VFQLANKNAAINSSLILWSGQLNPQGQAVGLVVSSIHPLVDAIIRTVEAGHPRKATRSNSRDS
jgi:hypothetical protein